MYLYLLKVDAYMKGNKNSEMQKSPDLCLWTESEQDHFVLFETVSPVTQASLELTM